MGSVKHYLDFDEVHFFKFYEDLTQTKLSSTLHMLMVLSNVWYKCRTKKNISVFLHYYYASNMCRKLRLLTYDVRRKF